MTRVRFELQPESYKLFNTVPLERLHLVLKCLILNLVLKCLVLNLVLKCLVLNLVLKCLVLRCVDTLTLPLWLLWHRPSDLRILTACDSIQLIPLLLIWWNWLLMLTCYSLSVLLEILSSVTSVIWSWKLGSGSYLAAKCELCFVSVNVLVLESSIHECCL